MKNPNWKNGDRCPAWHNNAINILPCLVTRVKCWAGPVLDLNDFERGFIIWGTDGRSFNHKHCSAGCVSLGTVTKVTSAWERHQWIGLEMVDQKHIFDDRDAHGLVWDVRKNRRLEAVLQVTRNVKNNHITGHTRYSFLTLFSASSHFWWLYISPQVK